MKKTILTLAILTLAILTSPVMAASQPVVNAGPDQYVNSNESVRLQATSYDQDGGNLTYFWSCTGGFLSNSNIIQPLYTVSNVYQNNNQINYTCTLTATNSYGLSNSDSTTIYVNYNQVGNSSVQTGSATNISNYQATLQGNLAIPYISNTNYVWFQWGTTNNYGNETTHQTITSGSFNQNITGLNANTTYHFRAVAQTNSGTIYGQDLTFYTSGSYYNTNSLAINKKAINLSSGNLNWSEYVSAKPYDVLSFSITMQANGNQDIHNVYVRDVLPSNLIYKGNLTVNSNLNYSGDPVSGLNIGTIPANGIVIIAYQVQVAGNQNFNYGNTTLTNTITVTSNEVSSQTDSATVFVTNSSIAGATDVVTGVTNNFLVDSFFLPLMIILLSAWLYFSKKIYNFADWLKVKIKR